MPKTVHEIVADITTAGHEMAEAVHENRIVRAEIDAIVSEAIERLTPLIERRERANDRMRAADLRLSDAVRVERPEPKPEGWAATRVLVLGREENSATGAILIAIDTIGAKWHEAQKAAKAHGGEVYAPADGPAVLTPEGAAFARAVARIERRVCALEPCRKNSATLHEYTGAPGEGGACRFCGLPHP